MIPNSSRRLTLRFATLLIGSVFLGASMGLDEPADEAAGKTPTTSPSSSIYPAKDDPNLPRVLLIGDSISMGYTLRTRKLFDGVANIHRPSTNCGSTTRGLAELDRWLTYHNTAGKSDRKWDIIHFNFGLHDLKYINSRGQTVDHREGRQNVPPEKYEQNLRTLVSRLKATGATVIWASTTPVQPVMPGHLSADVIKYNEIAAKVMKENDIPINDLYNAVLPRLDELQLPENVHFRGIGSDVMAAEVKKAVGTALTERADK